MLAVTASEDARDDVQNRAAFLVQQDDASGNDHPAVALRQWRQFRLDLTRHGLNFFLQTRGQCSIADKLTLKTWRKLFPPDREEYL